MTMLVSELAEHLKELDEVTLIELLGVDSETIVDRMQDIIEEKYEVLLAAIE